MIDQRFAHLAIEINLQVVRTQFLLAEKTEFIAETFKFTRMRRLLAEFDSLRYYATEPNAERGSEGMLPAATWRTYALNDDQSSLSTLAIIPKDELSRPGYRMSWYLPPAAVRPFPDETAFSQNGKDISYELLDICFANLIEVCGCAS